MSKYLIQDSRGYVGNDVLWWGPDGCGYTTDIDKAGRYTEEYATKQHRDRKTDIPFKESDILPLVGRTVDMQKLRRLKESLKLAKASPATVIPDDIPF